MYNTNTSKIGIIMINKKVFFILAIYFLSMLSLKANILNTYELTVPVAIQATKGWDLYKNKNFSGSFNGGYYTDINITAKGYDFWSNGKFAKYDRDFNGHHETIFLIKDEKLVYVGSIGRKGTFVDVSNKFINLLNKSITRLRTKY